MNSSHYDAVVVGAGIVGLTLARALKQRYPAWRVVVLDKESHLGAHASGRNSGVLHSGIYYPEGSLKAKVCAQGGKLMAEYCQQHQLPYRPLGKLVVPTDSGQGAQLDLLYQRGQANGAQVAMVDAAALHQMVPGVQSATGQALHVASAAVIDPKAVLHQLAQDLTALGVEVRLGQAVTAIQPAQSTLRCGSTALHYGLLLNASGLHADVIARQCGLTDRYGVMPFKGIYYKLRPDRGVSINHLIYPVPDLRVPFLGVHFTPSVQGHVYVGPTAVPALGRENYVGFEKLHWPEAAGIVGDLVRQYYLDHQGFRAYAHQEAGRFLKWRFAAAARQLVPALRTRDLQACGKVGIRAQLLDRETQQLVMDFLVTTMGNTVHVLNAVSPAFTSAMAFAQLVVDGLAPASGEVALPSALPNALAAAL